MLGAELVDTILGVYDKLPEDFTVFVSGTTRKSLPDRIMSFDFLMTRSLPVPVCKVAREKVTLLSPLCYIYTSGTTGYLHVKTSNWICLHEMLMLHYLFCSLRILKRALLMTDFIMKMVQYLVHKLLELIPYVHFSFRLFFIFIMRFILWRFTQTSNNKPRERDQTNTRLPRNRLQSPGCDVCRDAIVSQRRHMCRCFQHYRRG